MGKLGRDKVYKPKHSKTVNILIETVRRCNGSRVVKLYAWYDKTWTLFKVIPGCKLNKVEVRRVVRE